MRKKCWRRTPIGRTVLLLALGFVVGCGASPSSDEAAPAVQATPASDTVSSPSLDRLTARTGDQTVAQRIHDTSLETRVHLALVDAADLRAFDLDPRAVDGQIVLQGHVETLDQIDQAVSVASEVEGVRDVISELTSTEEPTVVAADTTGPAKDSASVSTGRDGEAGAQRVDSADGAGDEQGEGAEPEAAQAEPEATFHTVKSGDNLWDIARTYGVSVDQIRRLNDLGSSSIRPGRQLRIE